MQTIAAGVFKAKCLAIMDEVQQKREAVLITKNGKPVAQLVPINEEQDDIFGFFADGLEITGDVVAPAIPASAWKRLK
jgi:prevent-host-death family protein